MEKYKEILDTWRDHFEWRFIEANYPKCNILDYGCGYGYSDIWLARAGYDVTGYDPNSDRISVARYLLGIQALEVQRRLFFTDSREWWQFDFALVWCSHVLEHVPFEGWFQIFGDFSAFKYAKVLVSVPFDRAYDMPEHIHHWVSADDFKRHLEAYSSKKWRVWIDTEHPVIRGTLL